VDRALLVLGDGAVFEGRSVGAEGYADGELVFNTSMTGYQEMLTDPSYAGQLLVLTYPMIGNYGVDEAVEESADIQPKGLVVREMASFHSHLRSEGDLSQFLKRRDVVAIDQIDTRAVTRRLRKNGVMPATITTTETTEQAAVRLRAFPNYDGTNWAATVTTPSTYSWPDGGTRFRVALLDGGVKRNIMRSLAKRGCSVDVFPLGTPASDILESAPDGILLSPGPGNPALLQAVANEVRGLIGKAPVFGICLGHQIVASAMGAGFFKLPFGHRGGNHPVKDLKTGRVTVTAQNHGYAVDPDGLPGDVAVSHINLNDETVEGLTLRSEPVMTIQYHSEASPGPLDSMPIFDRFIEMMEAIPVGRIR
jgi:carbamoyl-phosphate synthase small subunit